MGVASETRPGAPRSTPQNDRGLPEHDHAHEASARALAKADVASSLWCPGQDLLRSTASFALVVTAVGRDPARERPAITRRAASAFHMAEASHAAWPLILQAIQRRKEGCGCQTEDLSPESA